MGYAVTVPRILALYFEGEVTDYPLVLAGTRVGETRSWPI